MYTIKQRRPFQKVCISYDLCKNRNMGLVWISVSIHINGESEKRRIFEHGKYCRRSYCCMDIHIIVCFSNFPGYKQRMNPDSSYGLGETAMGPCKLITYQIPHHFGRNADGERSYVHTLEEEIREKLLNKFCYEPEVFIKIEAV